TVAPPARPYADTDPSISGVAAREGETLSADPGVWTGASPISLAYHWERCSTVNDACADIPGATGAAYKIVSADVGSRIDVRVEATNAGGTGKAWSGLTSVVVPMAFAPDTAPPVVTLKAPKRTPKLAKALKSGIVISGVTTSEPCTLTGQ